MKKSSKRFTISTEAENRHGFRVKNEGIDFSEFASNPIMLWMHRRPKGESKEEILPLGFWEDIELRDGKWTAVPVFDDTDPFAVTIANKVENNTIRMASAGLKPKSGDNAWGIVDGEPWLLQSEAVEISIVDIGSNPEALAVALYDDNNQLITLSADYLQTILTPKSNTNMKVINLSADVLPVIGLAEGAKPEDVAAKITEIVTLAADQKNQLVTLAAEKTAAEAKVAEIQIKLDEQVNLATEAKVVALVDKGEADRKYTADQKPNLVKLAKLDFEGTKSLIDSMPSNPTAKSVVTLGTASATDELIKLSWDELDKSGKLIALKAADPEIFKAKFKEKFGTEYKG